MAERLAATNRQRCDHCPHRLYATTLPDAQPRQGCASLSPSPQPAASRRKPLSRDVKALIIAVIICVALLAVRFYHAYEIYLPCPDGTERIGKYVPGATG